MKDDPGQKERRKSDRRDADRRLDELSALYRVASLATTHGDPTAIMQEVVNVVSDAVGSERAMLFLYDIPSNQLVLKADGPHSEVRILLPDAPLLAKVIRSRSPEISNDLSRDSGGRSVLISYHQMESCSIGTNPATSAVGPDHETHEVKDLFVVDGSNFPTASGVNPMLSIYGFANRAAKKISTRLT